MVSYGTAQFKLDINTHVTLGLLINFVMLLISGMRVDDLRLQFDP